jgi:UDP-N-acetylmuramate: L-alanyl-gamma-D-glutamyl-meso-diaminopimelate ligase
MGVHRKALAESLAQADRVFIYQPENLDWDLSELKDYADNIQLCSSIDAIISKLASEVHPNSHFLMMSNGGFGGIYQRLQDEL